MISHLTRPVFVLCDGVIHICLAKNWNNSDKRGSVMVCGQFLCGPRFDSSFYSNVSLSLCADCGMYFVPR